MRQLIESKTPKTLNALPDGGQGWAVSHLFFARVGFTPASRQFAQEFRIEMVDLAGLEKEI